MTRSKVVKKLDAVFSEYIRLRNADKNGNVTCFTCGKVEYWKRKGMQAGHFQSRKHYATRWDEINVQVQCSGCNVFKYGEQYKFALNLDKQFGDGTAEELFIKAKEIVKFSTKELETLITYYKDQVNLLDK
jgi:hypothetical protein